MLIKKITHGWVEQTFDSISGVFIRQEFFVGNDVTFEEPTYGPFIPNNPEKFHASFDMLQPKPEAIRKGNKE